MAVSPSTSRALREVGYGFRVERATATLPQTTAAAIFNILGGRVFITSIIGEVTVITQVLLNNTKLIANPTVATSVDMCAVLDTTTKEVGCLIGITGVPADALVAANAGLTRVMGNRLCLNVGSIDLSCSASATGSVKWSLTYVPLDNGAYVEAA